MTAKGLRHAFDMAKARVRSVSTGVGRVHEHATQDRCSAPVYDAFWWARGCSLVQEMRALSEVPYVVSTVW